MFVVQIWYLYLVNRLLYGVLPETTFFDKNGLTWPQFDLYNFWPWMTSDNFFRGCVELMPGEVLNISKRYSQRNLSYWRKTTRGPFGPPIRSRVKNCSCGTSINFFGGYVTWFDLVTWPHVTQTIFYSRCKIDQWKGMRFCYAAPLRFRVIVEKPQGGGKWPPHTRAKVNAVHRLAFLIEVSSCFTTQFGDFFNPVQCPRRRIWLSITTQQRPHHCAGLQMWVLNLRILLRITEIVSDIFRHSTYRYVVCMLLLKPY